MIRRKLSVEYMIFNVMLYAMSRVQHILHDINLISNLINLDLLVSCYVFQYHLKTAIIIYVYVHFQDIVFRRHNYAIKL